MSATTTLRMILLGEDKSAGKTLKGVGTEADKSATKMDKFHKVGTAAGKALAGGFLLAGAAAVQMTKNAAADDAAHRKLAIGIKNATGATDQQVSSVEDWISAQGVALGVTDDDLRPAFQRLVQSTGSITEAQKQAAIAMDVSAGTGKSLKVVTEAIMKANNGTTASLSKLGLKTKDAHGNTLSLDAAMKSMSETFKGQAAKQADSVQGKTVRMQVAFDELQESIGYKLIPIMMKLAEIGLKVVNWVSHNTTTVGILAGVLVGLVAVTWAVSAATKAWAAITKVATAAQWLFNTAMDANPLALVAIAVIALGVALVIAYKKSATFRAIVQGAFHGVQVVAEKVAGFFTNQIPAAFRKVVGAATSTVGWVKSHWPLLLAILTGPIGLAVLVIARNWDKIKAGAGAVATFVRGKFDDLVGFVKGLPGRFADAARGMFDGIKNAFRAALNYIIGKWNGLSFSIPGVNTHIPGVGTVGGFTLSTPDIPYLAKGGIVNRPTLAVIGEAGPEAVIPLSGRNGFGHGGSAGGEQDLGTFGLDLKLEGRTVQKVLLKLKRESGGISLGLA